jgi:hypothetical protein
VRGQSDAIDPSDMRHPPASHVAPAKPVLATTCPVEQVRCCLLSGDGYKAARISRCSGWRCGWLAGGGVCTAAGDAGDRFLSGSTFEMMHEYVAAFHLGLADAGTQRAEMC